MQSAFFFICGRKFFFSLWKLLFIFGVLKIPFGCLFLELFPLWSWFLVISFLLPSSLKCLDFIFKNEVKKSCLGVLCI